MHNLEDVLFDATDEIHDASNLDIDDILNESDESIKELNVEKANLILSEKKNEKQSIQFHPQQQYECLIRKYIEYDFGQQQTDSQIEKIEFSDESSFQEPQSLLEKIDEEERAIKKVQLEHINLVDIELQISNLEIHTHQVISNYLKNLQGKPCVIRCENDIVSVGTSTGEILVFAALNTDAFGILKYKSKVCAMDNTSNLLVAGYEDKKIILWDPNSKAQLKMIEHQQPLIAVKFVNDYRLILSDYLGCTFNCKINKMLWSYSIDVDKLLARNIHPFYQIQVQQQYAAFVCLEQVLIVRLDQQPFIYKRISRQIDDFTYPCVSWGQITNTEGYTEMIDLALCVSWGTHIEIYIVDNVGVKQKFSFLYNNIINCSWVSRDMILIIDRQFNLITLNAQFFNQDSINEELRNILKKHPNYIQNKSEKAIQSTTPLGDGINHALQINNGKQLISIYNNCIHQFNRFTYLLTLPNLKRVKVMMWSDYMKKLIEKADSQESWYEILSFGLKLYWNQLYCFALPSNSYDQRVVIADISKDICSAFINLVGQKIEQQKIPEQQKYDEWEKAIVSAIQYCIECNQQQFLFTGLRILITKFHRYTQFLTNLEHFILSNSIKQIPMEILLHLSTHYKVMQKPDIVQQLILSLDPKFLDMTTIFQICQDNDLYTPLIVVCPRIEHDYITPLQKMYSNFLKTQNATMLLKSLWFINLTFKQILFPNSKIPDDVFKQAFSQIMMWLLLDDIFRNFAIHYPQELFETLKISININNAQLFNQEQMLRYFNFQKPILVAFIHKIYQSLNQTMVTYEKIGIYFSKFIGQVRGLALDEEVYVRALRYLVKDKQNFKYILNIVEQFDLKPSLKSELFQQSNYNYIQAVFATDVFQSIELCLQNINKHNFILLFQRFFTQKREIMINVLNFYFERLVDQDFEICKELVSSLTAQEQLKLMNRQHICDNYMELFHSLNPQNKELRHLYIKQCCIYSPNYVLDKISHFGLDDLEEIFLETKHKEGLGYIYARVGKFEMATRFFIQSLLEYLEECFKQENFNQELLNLKFQLLFDACRDSQLHDEINIYPLMGQLLFNKESSKIWRLSEQINENNYENMIPMLQILNNRLCEYYNKLEIEQLIILVEGQKEIFDMLWIKWSFKNLMESYRLQYRFWDRCHGIELQTYLHLKWSIFNENASSPEYDNECTQCTQQIVEPQQHVLIRRCGHSTHQSCLQQPFCHICNPKVKMQLEMVLANNQKFDLLDQKRREILIKESEQVKIHRQLEDQLEELQLTAEDIKIHEENRIMHDLELFDNFFNS